MIVRLGYVAIALKLPKVSSSGNVTFSTYSKIVSSDEKLNKLKKMTLSNCNNLYKILQYNIQNDIHFYRITSALIPLATHPEVSNWNYRKIFKVTFETIGKLINDHNIRVDTHPDQFNVINSTEEQVVKNTLRNLWLHARMFEDMNYKPGKMVLHIGSGQGGKEEASKRFINNLESFPLELSQILIFENDDKVFNAKDVLAICQKVNSPMVLDVHHHVCNNNGEALESMLGDIFDTWKGEALPPKVHFSSPRNGEKDRKHADYINPIDFVRFIEKAKDFNTDFDVMIEAKMKDLALYKLAADISSIRKDWKWIDRTTFKV